MTKSIVMIHGMWGGAWHWENFKQFFEEKGYQCHTPTLRYHDIDPQDTPSPDLATTSVLDYAQDLEEYIRGLDEKPLLMGHSMGGLLAQILTARGIACGAVLLCPAPPSGINNVTWSTIKSFRDIYTTWRFWQKPNRLSFKTAVYALLHLIPESEQKPLYEKFVYESGWAYFEMAYWYTGLTNASKVDETKVTCPVLVVAGTHDRATPASACRKVAVKYGPVSTYKEFENHAHWVIGEPGWENIAEFIADWINQIL